MAKNHADEMEMVDRQVSSDEKIDLRELINWSADQCCLFFQ